jgi:hypothetical protein
MKNLVIISGVPTLLKDNAKPEFMPWGQANVPLYPNKGSYDEVLPQSEWWAG